MDSVFAQTGSSTDHIGTMCKEDKMNLINTICFLAANDIWSADATSWMTGKFLENPSSVAQ